MLRNWIENNFGILVIISIILSFIFPPITPIFNDLYRVLPPHSLPPIFLGLMLFLVFLKIDYKDFLNTIKKPLPILFFVVVNLLIMPVLVYFGVTILLLPAAAVSFMLVSASPAASASPSISELCKTNTHYALATVIASSFVVPITIPTLISVLTGAKTNISFLEMFWKLFQIIIIPFILSLPIRLIPTTKKLIEKTQKYYKIINVFLLIAILFGAIDGLQAKFFAEPSKIPLFLLLGTAFFVIRYFLGLLLGLWMAVDVRLTYAQVSCFINIGLIIVFVHSLPDNFPNKSDILLYMVATQILWNLLLYPLQKFSHWVINRENKKSEIVSKPETIDN